MVRRMRAPLGAAVALALAAPPARAQEVMLRLAPPVGQATHYRTLNQTWMRIPGVSSADATVPTTQQTVYTTRTVTGMDGTAHIVMTVVDSSKTETPGMPAMAGLMGGRDLLRGMSTTQTIDPRGRVLSTDVTPPPGIPPQFAERIAQSASRGSPVMPQGAVAPGYTWTDSMTVAAPAGRGQQAETTIRMALRLERVAQEGGARVAIISINGAVRTDSAGGLPAGITAGTMTGELAVDLDAGRIARSTTDLTATVQTARGAIPMRIRNVSEALP